MPRNISEVLTRDGALDVRKLWSPTDKNKAIRRSPATNRLRVGGTGSSKSSDALMEVVQNYLLRWDGCHALFLRRNLTDLKKSSILDFKEFIPEQLYDWNGTDNVATFKATGSKLFFGHCLAIGTLITTDWGLVPIENIRPGNRVLTRQGFKRVTAAAQTGIKPTIRFHGLNVTPEHLIFNAGDFVAASELLELCEHQTRLCIHRPSFLKELPIVDTLMQSAEVSACITAVGETRERPDCTSLYGKACTDQYNLDTKYITKTNAQTITIRPTSKQSRSASTDGITYWDGSDPISVLEDSNTSQHPKSARHASSAMSYISGNTKHLCTAQLNATTCIGQLSVPTPVYDLQVEDVPEFFANGILVHNCANLSESDLAQYLSAAFPVIVIDECGQFSGDAWQFLQSRNRVNRECKPNEKGEFPKPVMLGCTNPIGPFWSFYRDTFIKKKPWNLDPEAKRSKDGSWWIARDGKYICIYNPADYDWIQSTILDNPHLMSRDPDLLRKLEALPKAKRDKFLYGELDGLSGQFFDCWEPGVHVITQEQMSESIIWQPWQPRWLGWDWGRVHYGAAIWMTLAQVKQPGGEFREKVVVYREYVDKGKDYRALANTISKLTRLGLPGASQEDRDKSTTLDAIYFSHEKFAVQMDRQSPAMLMSGYLTEIHLPAARRATQDRVGRANLLYDTLKTCGIVVLDTCPNVIDAIPLLIRNEKNIEDVLKQETKADDVYDGLSLGLFGQLGTATTPDEIQLTERLAQIEDPIWRAVQQVKATLDREKAQRVTENTSPDWLLEYREQQ